MERFENEGLLLGRDHAVAVRDLCPTQVSGAPDRDLDRSFARAVLNRVTDEILKHLRQAAAVPVSSAIALAVKADVSIRIGDLEFIDDLLCEVAQSALLRVEGQSAVL